MLLLLLLLLLLDKSVKLQFHSPLFILSVLSAHALIVRHALLNLTAGSTVQGNGLASHLGEGKVAITLEK